MDFSQLLAKEIAKKKATVKKALEEESTPANSDTSRHSSALKKKKYVSKADLKRAAQDLQDEDEKKTLERKNTGEKSSQLKRPHDEEDDGDYERRRRKVRESLIQKKKEEEAKRQEEKKEIEDLKKLPEGLLSDSELKVELEKRGVSYEKLEKEDRLALVKRLHKLKVKEEKKRRIELEDTTDMEIVEDEISSNREKVQIQMSATIRTLLSEWKNVLESKEDTPESAKEVLRETVSYSKPLLNRLRNTDEALPEKLYAKLARLLMNIQQHQYRDANATYIKMSIGNAAWPVGVTAVGIHARSARERITGENNEASGVDVAHILSDEDTRKWIIAVKRFVTFAEAHLQEKSFKGGIKG